MQGCLEQMKQFNDSIDPRKDSQMLAFDIKGSSSSPHPTSLSQESFDVTPQQSYPSLIQMGVELLSLSLHTSKSNSKSNSKSMENEREREAEEAYFHPFFPWLVTSNRIKIFSLGS